MALAQKQVKITFTVIDKATGTTTRITKHMQKNLTKLTTSVTTVQKSMGRVIKTTRTYASVQRSLSQTLGQVATGLGGIGRKLVFTGFIFNAVSRRVIRALKGIMNAFMKLIKEGADFDAQMAWLSKTITKLAIGGADLSEYMGDVMRVFEDGFENARDLGRELADMDIHFKDIKNAILEHTIPALSSFNETLDGLDWESLKESLGNVVTNFLTPIMDAIDELLGPENIGGLMEDLETVASLVGEFVAGFVGGIENIISWISDIDDLIGGDESGLKGIAYWAGEVIAAFALIAIPAIMIGGLTSTLGNAITGITTAVGTLAGAIGLTGTSGLLLALGAIATIGAAVILHWEEDFKPALQDFGDAVDNLFDALSGGDDAATAWEWLMDVLKKATEPVAKVLSGFIEDVAWLLNRIADIQRALSSLGGMRGGLGGGGLGEEAARQWGGPIPKSGLYRLHQGEYVIPRRRANVNIGGSDVHVYVTLDGRQIAHQVSRQMGRKVRSTLLLP